MNRFVWLTLLLVAFLSTSSVATAAEYRFIHEETFDPRADYQWRDGGASAGRYFIELPNTYTVFKYDNYYFKYYEFFAQKAGFMVAVCPARTYSSSCQDYMRSGSSNGISIDFIDIPSGHYVLLGYQEEILPPTPPPTVSISPDSREFTDSLTVTITGSSGSDVFYSTNGSEPSVKYTGPFTLTSTTTVKAKAVNSAGTSPVVTKVYTKKQVDPPDPDPPDPDPPVPDPGGGGGGNVGGTLPDYNLMDDPVFSGTFWNYLGSVMKLGLPFLLIAVALLVVEMVVVLLIDVSRSRKQKDDDDDW